ncbi:MAG: D-tyrosyl-tRNA(Tyr) deacylase [Ruminiclostridium sp.]|nr:D-tyrosyl-tRNA(Tyr) deacylase [Ruminiclostridium sp.]
MRFVVQRTTGASVSVDGKTVGEIGIGFVVLVGIGGGDTREIADKMIKKLLALRIFDDENGKTNLSLSDVGGELLIISQFTLYADCRHGNRPSFIKAGEPRLAEELYEYIAAECGKQFPVQKGIFGAEMKVSLLNDGPFTIILDSEQLLPKESKNGTE